MINDGWSTNHPQMIRWERRDKSTKVFYSQDTPLSTMYDEQQMYRMGHKIKICMKDTVCWEL
jgi:hypothetical protein